VVRKRASPILCDGQPVIEADPERVRLAQLGIAVRANLRIQAEHRQIAALNRGNPAR
jgi:hypothetical protein